MHLNCNVFDCHCDTVKVKNLFHTKTHLNVRGMKKYRRYIQVFAICSENINTYSQLDYYINRFERLLRIWDLEKITEKETLNKARYGAILSLEGADLVNSLASLEQFYKKGVRLITLTWNNSNELASSIMAQNDCGLSEYGKRFVNKCEDLGVVVDLSHISDKSFFDVCEIAKKPFICSHSNSRTIKAQARNITDEQFGEIIKHNGCTGINFYHEFIGGSASLSDIIGHIEHFCALGGEKNIGIGSDFDGIDRMPDGCRGAEFMYVLSNELLKLNYPEKVVKGVMFDNFNRVFLKILK